MSNDKFSRILIMAGFNRSMLSSSSSTMKKMKKYYTVRTVPKFITKTAERGIIDTANIQRHFNKKWRG
jgi:hypothetical protein